MEYTLIDWLVGLIREFAKFGTWLTTNLPYLDITPLQLIGFTGLSVVIVFLIARLVVGG